MGGLLLTGLFIGMRHALEADHVAAVTALAGGNRSLAQTIRIGGAWGLGHTVTLFLFGSIALLMDMTMPGHLAKGLELAVGFMLLGLGADVLRRAFWQRPSNRKSGVLPRSGRDLLTVGEGGRADSPAARGFPWRALLVGLMHGMAGSAALILLVLESVTSPLRGLLYILTFGVGSMLGMSLLSAAIGIPMQVSAKRLTWAYPGVQVSIAVLTLGTGVFVLCRHS